MNSHKLQIGLPVLFLFCLSQVACQNVTIKFSDTDLNLEMDTTTNVTLSISEALTEDTKFVFTYDDDFVDEYLIIEPVPNITVDASSGQTSWAVTLVAGNPGNVVLGLNSTSPEIDDVDGAFVRIQCVHSMALIYINAVIGWIYFAAWSVSFYPQVYINYRRKSVTGLNFDFLCYNLTGFLAYGVFNVGMYWIPEVQGEYFEEHPRGINPVQLNDVCFTLHAVFITTVTILQCCIYERGGQRVSYVCTVLVSGAWLFSLAALIATICGAITWLTYLYYFSYIKLGITLIKYIPQAWMNFKRKSTVGWSIGNILLDFTGGSLSLLQMFLLSYNSDDYSSIFGDPTKFGLGFFSILFDILFIVQHYVLYRGLQPYQTFTNQEVNVDINKTNASEAHDEEIPNIY